MKRRAQAFSPECPSPAPWPAGGALGGRPSRRGPGPVPTWSCRTASLRPRSGGRVGFLRKEKRTRLRPATDASGGRPDVKGAPRRAPGRAEAAGCPRASQHLSTCAVLARSLEGAGRGCRAWAASAAPPAWTRTGRGLLRHTDYHTSGGRAGGTCRRHQGPGDAAPLGDLCGPAEGAPALCPGELPPPAAPAPESRASTSLPRLGTPSRSVMGSRPPQQTDERA